MKKHWTKEEIKLLHKYFPQGCEMAAQHLPSRTRTAIRVKARAEGLVQYQHWEPWAIELFRHVYTDGGVDAVQRWFPQRSSASIRNLACRLGIKGPIHLRGRGGHFRTGHIPYYKGKKMPAHTITPRQRAVQFRPGNIPPLTKPVGTRVYCSRGVSVKVAEHRWVLEHRLVYQQHHGVTLQRQDKVIHINGDRTDNRIDNLRLVTSADLAAYARYTASHYPPDLRTAIDALGRFNHSLTLKERQKNR